MTKTTILSQTLGYSPMDASLLAINVRNVTVLRGLGTPLTSLLPGCQKCTSGNPDGVQGLLHGPRGAHPEVCTGGGAPTRVYWEAYTGGIHPPGYPGGIPGGVHLSSLGPGRLLTGYKPPP